MTETIKNFPDLLHRTTHAFYREVPSQVAARRFIDALINLLFPIREKKCISLKEMDLKWENLQNDLQEIIKPLCPEECHCEKLIEHFFNEVPTIYSHLMEDATLYKECDPAAYCTEEVILCYPGFYAVTVYRFSHILLVPRLPGNAGRSHHDSEKFMLPSDGLSIRSQKGCLS